MVRKAGHKSRAKTGDGKRCPKHAEGNRCLLGDGHGGECLFGLGAGTPVPQHRRQK